MKGKKVIPWLKKAVTRVMPQWFHPQCFWTNTEVNLMAGNLFGMNSAKILLPLSISFISFSREIEPKRKTDNSLKTGNCPNYSY